MYDLLARSSAVCTVLDDTHCVVNPCNTHYMDTMKGVSLIWMIIIIMVVA